MKKGFTLIELLVVVSIIGILATVLVVNLSSSQVKARNARIQNDVEQLSSAAEIILLGSGRFAGNSSGLITTDVNKQITDNTADGTHVAITSFKEENSTVPLISVAPVNPASSSVSSDWYARYIINSSADGSKYVIYTLAADTFKTLAPTLAAGDKLFYCKTGKSCSYKILTITDVATPSY